MDNFTRLIQRNGKHCGLQELAGLVTKFLKTGNETPLLDPAVSIHSLGRLYSPDLYNHVTHYWSDSESGFFRLSLVSCASNRTGFLSENGAEILFDSINIMFHREALFDENHFNHLLNHLMEAGFDNGQIRRLLCPAEKHSWKGWFVSSSADLPAWKKGFEKFIWELPDDQIVDLMNCLGTTKQPLAVALLRFRPETFGKWIRQTNVVGMKTHPKDTLIEETLKHTTDYDDEFARMLKSANSSGLVHLLDRLRPGKFDQQKAKAALSSGSFEWLAEHDPRLMIEELNKELHDGTLQTKSLLSSKVWNTCARHLENTRSIFEAIISPNQKWFTMKPAIEALVTHAPPGDKAYVSDCCKRALKWVEGDPSGMIMIWRSINRNPIFLEPYLDDLRKALGDKTLRSEAAYALSKISKDNYAQYCRELLTSGESSKVTLALKLLGDTSTVDGKLVLLEVLPSTEAKTLRDRILKKLELLGVDTAPYRTNDPKWAKPALDKEVPRNQRRPTIKWLDLSTLPLLRRRDGATMSEAAGWFLLEKQKNHREIGEAEESAETLKALDPAGNADFAMRVLNGYLASDQKASDRWALSIAGLLGDSQVIHPLLSRIPDWCENSRHKLAEYAAQAISLLPGNEPLMVLDTLANRYRSKFKNVGKACAEAFNAAAKARGITPDELGDLVVPDFGFDAEGIRRFEWNGGGANAELGADFKLSWFDPVSGKAWKALPASANEEIKTEVKTLGKLLRETVKAQTLRLEMSLVRQRRWTVSRWRDLYENHPVLRSFACGLVWGVYDSSGALLRSFRRYSNGILADASGNIEELAETDAVIGMIHPLELGAADLDAWKAHLTRLKVKPPFPQLDRPVEWMDPLHGNRRKISITEGRKVGAGTFKSRSEKRGWLRGSVVDAGGISSIYKSFPGAGIEVVLMTDNYWIGIDPLDQVELGDACFVKADTVSRGSYTYDEPASDDPRVLRFDQVPEVVYSETIGDLKAIIATKE